MWTSACDFIGLKDESAWSSARTATCITCGNVPNVWGFQSWSSSAASPGFDRKAGLSHKMKWSVQLCAPASTGGSPHSALLGVRYTLERHAGIIRDPRLLKKLRNSHELHCGRWINRPRLELWEDFFFFFFLPKQAFLCVWSRLSTAWMSFSWFALMLSGFQMLIPLHTDGRSNFKVRILCRKLQLTSKIRISLKIGWCLHACFVETQHTFFFFFFHKSSPNTLNAC